MADKIYFDVIVFNERVNKDSGEVSKARPYTVGYAYERDNGGWSVTIADNISVTGSFAILPRKERD